MRIAYLECFSGISGDMFLGALVDSGVPARTLQEAVEALGLGARLQISQVVRSGISATKIDVWVNGAKDKPRMEHREEIVRRIILMRMTIITDIPMTVDTSILIRMSRPGRDCLRVMSMDAD